MDRIAKGRADPAGAWRARRHHQDHAPGTGAGWAGRGPPPGNYVLHREKATDRIVGRVLDKGLGGDEMGERVRLVIDGVDGRLHHIEMDAARAEEAGRGMIIAAGSAPARPRAADRNI